MSKTFRPLILIKNVITYLDVVFYAITKKHEIFEVLEKHHKIFLKENLKAAPDKSHFVLTRVKFVGHITEGNLITPLKSRIDATLKLQHVSNKKKNQEVYRLLNF